MSADNFESAANEQSEEKKIKKVSQSHPDWKPELECVVHNAKPTASDPPRQKATFVIYRACQLWWMAFYRGRAPAENISYKKMPDVDSSDSSSGIAVDVQQRLNCALP